MYKSSYGNKLIFAAIVDAINVLTNNEESPDELTMTYEPENKRIVCVSTSEETYVIHQNFADIKPDSLTYEYTVTSGAKSRKCTKQFDHILFVDSIGTVLEKVDETYVRLDGLPDHFVFKRVVFGSAGRPTTQIKDMERVALDCKTLTFKRRF